MATLRIVQYTILLGLLAGCGAPIFHSEEERFAPAPELIEQIEPYLEEWATTPPEQTLAERQEFARQIDGIIGIDTGWPQITDSGETIYILTIILDVWGDWERGYFYVHAGSELSEYPGLHLRQVDEHFYIFNRNT